MKWYKAILCTFSLDWIQDLAYERKRTQVSTRHSIFFCVFVLANTWQQIAHSPAFWGDDSEFTDDAESTEDAENMQISKYSAVRASGTILQVISARRQQTNHVAERFRAMQWHSRSQCVSVSSTVNLSTLLRSVDSPLFCLSPEMDHQTSDNRDLSR